MESTLGLHSDNEKPCSFPDYGQGQNDEKCKNID